MAKCERDVRFKGAGVEFSTVRNGNLNCIVHKSDSEFALKLINHKPNKVEFTLEIDALQDYVEFNNNGYSPHLRKTRIISASSPNSKVETNEFTEIRPNSSALPQIQYLPSETLQVDIECENDLRFPPPGKKNSAWNDSTTESIKIDVKIP